MRRLRSQEITVDGDKKKVIKRTKKSKQPKGEDVVTTEVVPDLEKDEEITIEEITVDGDKKKVIKRTKKAQAAQG
ncbi:hypothetical protein TYRP_010205 [Tyrophagus putrescentiae]|nr:hypothetical protein TYRP_010205 [Tyrophagus putrescentiae]